jgi:hypothetical protein
MNRRQRRASASAEKQQLRKKIKAIAEGSSVSSLGCQLRQIPPQERVLLVTFGRLLNEIAMLSKVAWWCGQHCEGKAFDDPARLSQSFSMLLIYIGKLYE